MNIPTPVVTGTSRIKVRDSRGTEVVLPRSWTLTPFNRARFITSVKLTGGDGEFRTKRDSFEPLSFVLRGYVYGSDTSDLRVQINSILRHVPYGPWDVYPDGFAGRHVKAHVVNTAEESLGALEHAMLNLEMTAFEPFFYGPTAINAPAIKEISGATGQFQSVTNPGSYLVRPYIVFTGRAGTSPLPTVKNLTTDQVVTLDFTLQNGDVAIIDCERGRATVDDANALNALNATFYYNPLHLDPGVNDLEFSVSGGGDVRVDLEFTPRYL